MPKPTPLLTAIGDVLRETYRERIIAELNAGLTISGFLPPRPDPEPTDDTTYDFWTGRYTPDLDDLDDWDYDH